MIYDGVTPPSLLAKECFVPEFITLSRAGPVIREFRSDQNHDNRFSHSKCLISESSFNVLNNETSQYLIILKKVDILCEFNVLAAAVGTGHDK